jgi:hypothetical protein
MARRRVFQRLPLKTNRVRHFRRVLALEQA